MQLTFDPKQLASEIASVCRIAKSKGTLPILTTLRIRVLGENDIRVDATDLEHSLSVRVSATCDSSGERILPAHLLSTALKGLDGDTATLSDAESGWMVLECERTRIRLPSEDPAAFPVVRTNPKPNAPSLRIASSALRDALDATHFAISKDMARMSFAGLHVGRENDNAVFTATDGHRLAQTKMPAVWEGEWPLGGIIVPGFAVAKIRALNKRPAKEESTTIFRADDGELFVYFVGEPVDFTSRLIPGRFPNIAQVLPSEAPPSATVSPDALQATLKRAKAHAPKTGHVRLALERGSIRVTASGDTTGSFDETLECEFDASPVEMGFNVKYLLDMLNATVGNTVGIGIQNTEAPTLINDSGRPDVTWVVMPMQF